MEQKISVTSSDIPQANHQDLAAKGHEFFKQGKPAMAQKYFVPALILDPENKQYKNFLIECFPNVKYPKFNPQVKKAITLCLQDADTAYRKVSAAWLSQIILDPEMHNLVMLLNCKDYKNFREEMDVEGIIPLLNNPFFILGLKKCLLMDLEFEFLITRLRKFYLLEATEEQKEKSLPFLCALGTKCFNNDYIFDVSAEEEDVCNVVKLSSLPDIAVASCYSPLYRFENPVKISKEAHHSKNQDVIDLIQLQIDNPLKEQDLIKKIESFSSIKDRISGEVQAQYEEHPYPRWTSCALVNLNKEQKQQSIDKEILIAGCGTGQEAILTSYRMPNANIDAVDLSRTSLGYAARKAQEKEIKNIRFLHGDLLETEKLQKSYDLIFSSGVLHHMKNPQAGLQALCNILKPGGVIAISLYSDIARQHIAFCQQWVKEQRYASTTKGMRQFRQDIMKMDDNNPLKKMVYISDFYTASECRDLIFHVQEHRFNCLTLKEMIESLDLSLLHFGVRMLGVRRKYCEQYPDDPLAINLENWHQFETQNPQSFLQMYDLLLGPKEYHEAGTQPQWLQKLRIFQK